MDYNIIIILFIFIIIFFMIYHTYNNLKKSIPEKKIIEPFYVSNINIDTNLDHSILNTNGFVNELIPKKKELNSIKTKTINTCNKYEGINNGLISNYKELNNLNNTDEISKIFDECKPKKFNNINKEFFDKHFYKKDESTDLPLANAPTNFLLKNSLKLSEY